MLYCIYIIDVIRAVTLQGRIKQNTNTRFDFKISKFNSKLLNIKIHPYFMSSLYKIYIVIIQEL